MVKLTGGAQVSLTRPSKDCPVCHVAMQATTIENGVIHLCQQCGLTITVAPTSKKEA